MKYGIVGCITKYTPDDIRPYVESIKQTGFGGEKTMLVYDVPTETKMYLKENDWELYEGSLSQHIILQRFVDVSELSRSLSADVLMWTDVKDVIFQNDPSRWLYNNVRLPILATSETIRYKDEEWAVMNASNSYPLEWPWLKNKTSYCAGTIVAQKYALSDLFKEIYRWAITTSNPQQLSDQAAFNVLIHLKHFQNDVQFIKQHRRLVTHMGVSWDKRETHKDKLLEPPPVVSPDGRVLTSDGREFYIVHQYDRDPIVKKLIHERYK